MSSLSYYGKIPRFHVNVCSCIIILYSIFTKDFVYIINWENLFISRYKYQFLILIYNHKRITFRGGSRIFFRRGCTCLLLYFNTNKPHSFFFLQNTSCIRKPQVISGGRGDVHPLHPPLRSAPEDPAEGRPCLPKYW